jgi:hypothetical protein
VALAALVTGGAWLFAGLGGAWPAEDADVEARPAIGVVALGSGDGGGSLRMVSWPGASVYLDDDLAPLAVSPFAGVHVGPGRHELRVRVGPGSEEERVEISMPSEGQSFAIVPLGPTLSFRDLGVGLAAPDGGARRGLRELRGPGGADLVTGAFGAWTIAALAIASATPASRRRLDLLAHVAMTGPLGLVLLARAAVLAPFVPRAGWGTLIALVVVVSIAADRRVAQGTLEQAAARAGRLLVRFERWVLDAAFALAAASFRGLAWAVAWIDARTMVVPVDAVAVRVDRVGYRIEPAAGGSLARVGWTLLAGLAVALAAATVAAGR